MSVINRSTAPHYNWAKICDGWRLLDSDDLSVIQERMPPNTAEVVHFHEKAHQMFFVLQGSLTIEVDEEVVRLNVSDALNVEPGQVHQVRNEDDIQDVQFLVISSPTTRGDRRTA